MNSGFTFGFTFVGEGVVEFIAGVTTGRGIQYALEVGGTYSRGSIVDFFSFQSVVLEASEAVEGLRLAARGFEFV